LNPLLSYLKFWWYSKNEHSVHSPFVFDLITKCFYDRSNHSAYQQLSKNNANSKFLVRLSAYFKFDNCFVSETIQPEFEQALNIKQQTVAYKTIEDLKNKGSKISKTPCLIYLDLKVIDVHSIADILQIYHKDSLILVPSIRRSNHSFNRWNQLKSQSEISVSIDTFYWGLLFFRTEQPKEHFTIRR
jgi:hypothetical protein